MDFCQGNEKIVTNGVWEPEDEDISFNLEQ